jgi:acyl carrier protein
MGLDIVELIVTVEDVFHIHIADEEANSLSTVGDLHDFILGKLADSKRALASTDEVVDLERQDTWETLCQIVVKQTGLDRKIVTPESRILDDLGIG